MELLDQIRADLGAKYVVTGTDAEAWTRDWMNVYHWQPLAVVRPASTEQVQAIARACSAAGVAMVPVGGNTGLTGATKAQDAVMISLDRMNAIREIKPNAQVAIVESGAILDSIHQAVDVHNLVFPLFFGARGSAMIGGNLSTNAGGSNVLRYGNTRDLCLGLEVVLADGRVMNLMSELRKDNTGLNLKHMFIGAEGTLGIITAAVVRLYRKPLAYVTAMVGLRALEDSLPLLNRLQNETGGGVEAFEYMPRHYIERHMDKIESALEPFDDVHEVNILVEVATTRASDLEQDWSGTPKLQAILETALMDMIEAGSAQDVVIAQNEAQRRVMWERRESAAEITVGVPGSIDTDVAVPLDDVPAFLQQVSARVQEIDPDGQEFYISHLGDGNLHYTFYPSDTSGVFKEPITEAIEDVVLALNGSFSAEHGIGLSKRNSMARRKDPVALEMMRAIKSAFDPANLMNPGKVYPD
ncbi:MAG: FAD-binding oxidoreductase [Rhodobacterales bacterium]|tara:strand:+ start:119 stop:1528 length:1410 start_codon:yes stop_codon:yes gene_type:complete